MPYLAYLKSLKNERPLAQGSNAVLRPGTVIIFAIVWLCALVAILALIPNRDWSTGRVEGLNNLLQTTVPVGT